MVAWIELAVYVVAGLAIVALAVINSRKWAAQGGSPLDLWRASTAIVEVALDEEAAGALCKRALLEVNETRTTRRFKDRRLRALSHLDVTNPGGLSTQFELAPLGERRTRIVVSLYPVRGSLNLTITRKRKALTERLGRWIAEQGDGRVVKQGFGKLRFE